MLHEKVTWLDRQGHPLLGQQGQRAPRGLERQGLLGPERRAQELVLGLPQGLRVQVLRVLLGLVLVLAEQVLLAGQDRLRAVELLVDHPWNSPLIMLMS